MYLLAEDQVVVSPAHAREQSEIGQVLSIKPTDLAVVKELEMRIFWSPRVNVLFQGIDAPVATGLKLYQPA